MRWDYGLADIVHDKAAQLAACGAYPLNTFEEYITQLSSSSGFSGDTSPTALDLRGIVLCVVELVVVTTTFVSQGVCCPWMTVGCLRGTVTKCPTSRRCN